MQIPNFKITDRSAMAAMVAILLFAGASAKAQTEIGSGTSTVCSVVREKSSKYPGSQFLQELKKTYPSCANWLAKSCLSNFRLDVPSPALARLQESQPITNKDTCGQPTDGTNGGVFNCFRQDTDPLAQSRSNLSNVADTLKAAMDRDPAKVHQAEIVRLTLAQWKITNEKREQDLNTILSYYDKEALPQSLTNSDVKAAIRTLKGRVQSAATRAGGGEKVSWQKFVADQIADAGEDTVTSWKDSAGVDHRDVAPGFYSRLKLAASDDFRYSELVSRAHQVDTGEEADFDGNLTPYHSKMILLYNLENRIVEKYKDNPAKAEAVLNELGSKLNLKADFTSPGSGTQWKWVIPHDGFVLGASFKQINNFMAERPNLNEQKGSGTGVDCATFVQKILTKTGYSSMKTIGRMTSAGIATGGQLKGLASLEQLKFDSISKLGPGDLLIKREKGDPVGHVEVIAGYEGDPPNLVVISAEGGYQRSLIKRRLNIFPDQPHSCNQKNYFTEDKNLVFYRASLLKGPQ